VKGVDCLPESYSITSTDLIEAGGHALTRGDIALVRTGRMSYWPDKDAFMSSPPGLGMEAARWLARSAEVMSVGVDAGGEALPPEEQGSFLPVHSYLLADEGVPIIENLWLEDLSASGVSEVAFLAFALKLLGSTGVPVRPVAFALTDGSRELV
jgi:kynurenine formamidase